MAFYRTLSVVLPAVFIFFSYSVPSFPQQPGFQMSLMPAASGSSLSSSISIAADIVETHQESYLQSIQRNAAAKADQTFHPSSSDLLIQQAEERFRSGRKLYRVKDVEHARAEFDAAVDLMIQASISPTERTLYENKLDEMVDEIHRLDLAGLGAAAPMDDKAQFDKPPLDDILEMTFPVDPRLKSKVSEELHATNSALPLVMNDVVLSYINYFSGRGHSTIVAGLQRVGKYRPMITKVLAEEGVPQELIYLAQAESGFLPRAVSRAAAGGMWQFVKWRGNQYGLEQTSYSDDRFDPEKATRAAAHHLHDLYNEFGDWYLAIAAYNCGPGAIEKAVERTGYADFWELRARRAIPLETSNYVPIILAMTIMGKNAKEYGLNEITPESPVEYETVEITSPTSMALIGDLTETPVSYLIELNPALLKNVAPAGYSFRVPKMTSAALIAGLDSIPSERRLAWRMHRVEPGETLAAIAKQYGATAGSIQTTNNLITGDQPSAGDHLVIPAAYHEPPAAKAPAKRTLRSRGHVTATPQKTAGKPAAHPARKTTSTTASVTPAKKSQPKS